MPMYRKKPVVIEAFQLTKERYSNKAEWPEWLCRAWQLDRYMPGSLSQTEEGTDNGTLLLYTYEGQHLVLWDDWLILDAQGELCPCNPDIFAAAYELA